MQWGRGWCGRGTGGPGVGHRESRNRHRSKKECTGPSVAQTARAFRMTNRNPPLLAQRTREKWGTRHEVPHELGAKQVPPCARLALLGSCGVGMTSWAERPQTARPTGVHRSFSRAKGARLQDDKSKSPSLRLRSVENPTSCAKDAREMGHPARGPT